jgi:hypothetical protein
MQLTFVCACGKIEERKIHLYLKLGHVNWVPCHHGMALRQVADGGDSLQIWRVAVDILNK